MRLVHKETEVLYRWGNEIQKFGSINEVDKDDWPPESLYIVANILNQLSCYNHMFAELS